MTELYQILDHRLRHFNIVFEHLNNFEQCMFLNDRLSPSKLPTEAEVAWSLFTGFVPRVLGVGRTEALGVK